MTLILKEVLSPAAIAAVAKIAARDDVFIDGKATAGRQAKLVKRNRQTQATPLVKGALRKVESALWDHATFRSAARPRLLTRLMISRYDAGMAYGTHVDNALMDGRRTDLSMTLFLSEPESYEGGELVIEEQGGERRIKLAAGDAVLYPTSALHRVDTVRHGYRLAVVGWVQSHFRHAHQRETLHDLDQVIETLFAGHGKSPEVDRLARIRADLTRQWADA